MIFEPHLSFDELSAYALGLSSDVDLEDVEEHLLICARCQNELAQAIQYIRATKKAALTPTETGKRLRSVHVTGDGPIFEAIHIGAGGKSVARHWGRQLDGGRVCDSIEEANDYLTESFSQMFPEHKCSRQCRG